MQVVNHATNPHDPLEEGEDLPPMTSAELLVYRPDLLHLAPLIYLDGADSKISTGATITLHWLFHLAGKGESTLMWPGHEVMAGLARVSTRSITRYMNELLRLNLVKKDSPRLSPVTMVTIAVGSVPLKTGPKKGDKKKKEAMALSDAEISLACGSSNMMYRYITHGRAGLSDTPLAGLPSTPMDWSKVPGWTEQTPNPRAWTTHHLMGYYWYLVSWQREKDGQMLTLPDFGRLAQQISTLKQRMPTERAHRHIIDIFKYFSIIRLMAGQRITLELNEQTINNQIVNDKLNSIYRMNDNEIRSMAAKLQEQQSPEVED